LAREARHGPPFALTELLGKAVAGYFALGQILCFHKLKQIMRE
jgi:hypothetical protein